MLFEFEDKNLLVIEEKVRAEERLSFDDGVTLWNSFDLLGVGYLANIVRDRMHGNQTYFIHNRHINHTNICVNTCQFCAFGVKEDHPTAYTKSLEEIFSDAEKSCSSAFRHANSRLANWSALINIMSPNVS